jgi:hypothetical protein
MRESLDTPSEAGLMERSVRINSTCGTVLSA